MELFLVLDALKRASAARITAVMPYYGYSRQDRKVAPRSPISAKLMADLLTSAGADRVLSVDLHAGQISGFFNIPVDHIFGIPTLARSWRENYGFGSDFVVVSPDAGGVERTRAFAKRIEAPIAIIDKRRSAALITTYPYFRKISATLDLPQPIPPVKPTHNITRPLALLFSQI